jgi:ABC-2 type transport system permease protein
MSTSALTLSRRQRRAFGLLVASEIKIAIRRPIGLFVAVAIPFLLLVIFGSIPATTRPSAALGGISFFTLYVPTLMVFVLIAMGLAGLPQQLAAYRQQGVLRRMSTTPVPPSWLLAAQTTVSLILAGIGIGILLGAGAGAFGLALPRSVGGCLLSILALALTAGATLALGVLVAAVAKSPQIAQALTAVLFYPLAFFSGLYVPIQELHSAVLDDIAQVMPTGAGFNALHASFLGQSPSALPFLVLAGWTILASVLATRLFRWE